MEMNFEEGQVLLLDKPVGWTSFDVVNKVRQVIKHLNKGKKVKVGHAGTLDPLASGLVIICTGKATRKIEAMQLMEKEYMAMVEFGKTTPSYDLETDFDGEYPTVHITKDMLEEVLMRFRGTIEQVPPLYSAKHHNGERAYELARRGESSPLRPHTVEIYKLEISSFRMPEVQLQVNCSKGTYIRSLAHDIGMACASGAYLKGLRRTAIPPYQVEDALTPAMFEEKMKNFVSNTDILRINDLL